MLMLNLDNRIPTVLVVEDDIDMNSVLCDALEQAGYLAVPAFTGQDALDRQETYIPDAVLLDLMLPDMDGVEICRRLNAHPHKSTIIIVSARSDTASKLSSYVSGAHRYVTKPIDLDHLLRTLDAELRQREFPRGQRRDESA